MPKIKSVLLFATAFLLSGCYQWPGDLNTRITGLSLKPGGDVVAIGIVEQYSRYPMLNMSGWSRGVPKIRGRKGRIYYYNIRKQKIEEKMVIKFPQQWDAGNHQITLHFWQQEGIYFKLTGCPKTNQNCTEAEYYQLLSNGKIKQLKELPKMTQAYYKSLLGNDALTRFKNNTLTINVGHSGAWQPVLIYKDHKLLTVDKNNLNN